MRVDLDDFLAEFAESRPASRGLGVEPVALTRTYQELINRPNSFQTPRPGTSSMPEIFSDPFAVLLSAVFQEWNSRISITWS